MAAVPTKELRLALVCYGGSSLAVYMHGVTKELHRLVKGSALLEAGSAEGSPSEAVYGRLLEELARDRHFEASLVWRELAVLALIAVVLAARTIFG